MHPQGMMQCRYTNKWCEGETVQHYIDVKRKRKGLRKVIYVRCKGCAERRKPRGLELYAKD